MSLNRKLPPHLSQNTAQGLEPFESIETLGSRHARSPVAQFEIGDYKNFVYLILDWATRTAAIVDPQTDIQTPLQALDKNGFELSHVFLTHTHWDHIAGVPELVKKFENLPILVHAKDQHRLVQLSRGGARIQGVEDGQTILVGHLPVQVLYTPGHSAGEASYFISSTDGHPPFLFTGDTIFIRDCGRTDLETGSTQQMFDSIQRIKTLPPETVILPGHHYAKECASTLELEIQTSPPFLCQTSEELEALP